MTTTKDAIERAERIVTTRNAAVESPLMRFTSSRQSKTDQFFSSYADTDTKKIVLAGAVQLMEAGSDVNSVFATLTMVFDGATVQQHVVRILGYDRKWFSTLQKMGSKEIRNVATPKILYDQIKVLEIVLGEPPEPEHDFNAFGADLQFAMQKFIDEAGVPITAQFQKKLDALIKTARKMGDGEDAVPRMFIVDVQSGNIATANIFSGRKVVFASSIDALEDHLSCVKHDNPGYENSLETARNEWLMTQPDSEPEETPDSK